MLKSFDQMEKGEFGKKVEKKEEETPEELGKKFLEEKREELKKETSIWRFSIPQSFLFAFWFIYKWCRIRIIKSSFFASRANCAVFWKRIK